MTVLCDTDIKEALRSGRIYIDGMKEVGPASVDVYLDSSYVHLSDHYSYTMRNGDAALESCGFMLGSTIEVITLADDIMAQVHGCSSIGRTGLFVQNAGLIDPGFSGQITLELFNASAHIMHLVSGQRIAQLTFHELTNPCKVSYRKTGRYNDQRGATAAREKRTE